MVVRECDYIVVGDQKKSIWTNKLVQASSKTSGCFFAIVSNLRAASPGSLEHRNAKWVNGFLPNASRRNL